MSTTLNRLKQLSYGNGVSAPGVESGLDARWDRSELERHTVPTGNAAYWAALRPVQSPRVSRQGWRAVLNEIGRAHV